ncbi:MAG: metallophosphoesterase, partial [Actinomycetota bacterium]
MTIKQRHTLTRRELLAGAAGLVCLQSAVPSSAEAAGFCFPLLGDLHFDRLTHHDQAWLEREKPGDVSQVRNYSRLTAEALPRLFPELKEAIAASRLRVPFVVQVGDLVEGLCGTPEL